MCSLFGLIDYKEVLNQKWRNKAVAILARECEIRGTDATEIAYVSGLRLRIFKRALPSHRIKFNISMDANIIMGHTRMATQGNAKLNQNNHPFSSYSGITHFALAHNGILHNDKLLQKKNMLPATNIETDSY